MWYKVWGRVQLYSFTCGYPVILDNWHQFLKRPFFLQWIVLVPSCKSIDCNYEGTFPYLKSVPLLYIYAYPYANSTLINYRFAVKFWHQEVHLPTLLFLKIVLRLFGENFFFNIISCIYFYYLFFLGFQFFF